MSSETIQLNYLPRLPERTDVRIGCIGSGFIMADCQLVAYAAAGITPLGISSRTRERAAEVADRHGIPRVYDDYRELLADDDFEVIDIAVPPDCQADVIRDVVKRTNVRGILAQKPLGVELSEAKEIVAMCDAANIVLCVNQNMRYDQSVRACKSLLDHRSNGIAPLGKPVLGTIEMRAIPHWMPWQARHGWLTCRMMSIHHLDTMRFWFGDPKRVYASFARDPRTEFEHDDGIGLYILEYESGLRCQILDDVWAGPVREGAASDIGIDWRIEGTRGIARGTIGWPSYPEPTPSTLDYTTIDKGVWHQPRWQETWFPDAFLGPMAELLVSIENGSSPAISGADNLKTMALVDACYQSAREHRAIDVASVLAGN